MTPPEVVEHRHWVDGALIVDEHPVLTCCQFREQVDLLDGLWSDNWLHEHWFDDQSWGFDDNGEVWVVEHYQIQRRNFFVLRNDDAVNCQLCQRRVHRLRVVH